MSIDPLKLDSQIAEKQGRAKHILDVAVEEKRELTPGEDKEYDTLYGEISALRAVSDQIKNAEIEELRGKMVETPESPRPNADALLRGLGHNGTLITPERRDWTSGSGGATYLVPEDWFNEVISIRETNGVARASGMRTFTTQHTNNIPVFNGYGTAALKAEMTAYNEADASLTQVVMGAYKVTVRYDVAEEILADEEYGIGSVLAEAVGNAFATWEDNHFIGASGTGSGDASGVFAMAADASSATASGFTVEELISMVYGIDRSYRREAVWYMNDATVGYVAKKRTTASAVETFFWNDSVGGEPPRLYGYPVYTCSNIPSYTTSSAKIVCFANPRFYMIGERGPMEIRRLTLNEYSTTFAVSQRMDGHPLVPAAFYTLTTATA